MVVITTNPFFLRDITVDLANVVFFCNETRRSDDVSNRKNIGTEINIERTDTIIERNVKETIRLAVRSSDCCCD
jgi:hypothetical protein